MAQKITGFPAHFAPSTAPHSDSQIRLASEKFRNSSLASANDTALEKLKEQTTALGLVNDEAITWFLKIPAKDVPASDTHDDTEGTTGDTEDDSADSEYLALVNEYTILQNLELAAKTPITTYLSLAARSIDTIFKKFNLYLEKKKALFDKAYKNASLKQEEKDVLWKEYAENLKKMLDPLKDFECRIDCEHLLVQSMIHHVNTFLIPKQESPTAIDQTNNTEEKFIPKSQYTDSEGKSLNVEYDKKTGKAAVIRIESFSASFFGITGKSGSGSLQDAIATLYSSHGKIIPIKFEVQLINSNILTTEMDPGLIQALLLLVAWIFRKIEKIHYEKCLTQAVLKTGIPIANISLVDENAAPIPIPAKLKQKIAEQQREWEQKFAEHQEKIEKARHEADQQTVQSRPAPRAMA
jgi:hypothetical protein